MKIGHESPLDLNVRVLVLNKDNQVVRESRFKNTATKRMTDSIALFLAGDASTDAQDTAAAPKGKWRPNFVSFGTTGIDAQPTSAQGLATVLDPRAFADKCPEPGNRDRPWFYSTSIGAHYEHFWNPQYGWGSEDNPDVACFRGELVTACRPEDEATWAENNWTTIQRLPLLRADVTTDAIGEREVAQDGYGTDVIFYSYASVKWVDQFFNPENGPSVPRIAISEVGLYELDSSSESGRHSLMAGFRVPTVEDIIYVDPGEVILVEWRVSIRALMPYEGVQDIYEIAPTGVSIYATVLDTKTVQLHAVVHGPSLVSQNVIWSMTNNSTNLTTLSSTGLLHLDESETSDVIYVQAKAAVNQELYSSAAVLTGLIRDLVTGLSVSVVNSSESDIQLQASVLGRGTFSQQVTWSMTGNESPDTTIDSSGLITLAFEETAAEITVTATSVDNNLVYTVAAVVLIDKTSGTYVISDFSVLTQEEGD